MRAQAVEGKPMCIYYAPMPILKKYNEVDCRILWKGVDRLQEELELGGELKMTIASCAMRLFRSQFLKREIKTDVKVNRVTREAYVASRVEVFKHKLDRQLSLAEREKARPLLAQLDYPDDAWQKPEEYPSPASTSTSTPRSPRASRSLSRGNSGA